MTYREPLGFSIDDIIARQRQALDPYKQGEFKFTAEYLPIIIGFVGVVGLGLTYRLVKKRKKKRGRK